MALTIKKTAVAVVDVQKKDSGKLVSQSLEQEAVPLHEGATLVSSDPFCEVGFEAGYTHNLGNMQFAKIAVSIKIPAAYADINEAFDYGVEWVNSRVSKIVEEMTSGT